MSVLLAFVDQLEAVTVQESTRRCVFECVIDAGSISMEECNGVVAVGDGIGRGRL